MCLTRHPRHKQRQKFSTETSVEFTPTFITSPIMSSSPSFNSFQSVRAPQAPNMVNTGRLMLAHDMSSLICQ